MRRFTFAGWRLLVLTAVVVAGADRCAYATLPHIDPSGQRVFLWDSPFHHGGQRTPFQPEPAHPTHKNTLFMRVAPARAIAPVGAEVILISSICASDGYMRANERVEWMLAPGGVGQFVTLGERGFLDCLAHPKEPPKKLDNSYAIGTTSARYISLTRGTPTYDDDVPVQKGQAWVSVTSPVEGVSYVTAFAPSVYGWDQRQRTSTIYWVDAQWNLPPPATNPVATSHAFTTTLNRQTDRAPLAGWIVRYEITGGPAAGFAPDMRPAVDVTSDALGQATAEIVQQQPSPGTNTISIQIIRPPELPGGYGQRLVVGNGTTTKTWSPPGNLNLRMIGPSQATVGSTVTFRADVNNPSALSVRNVVITSPMPKGLTFVSSIPPAQPAGNQLQWQLGDLGAGSARAIEIDYRADSAGTVTSCAMLAAGDGLSAQSCATTTIVETPVPAQSLSLVMTAPATANVGQDVDFVAIATNRGAAPTPNLVVVDRFDAGLTHPTQTSPIEHDIPSIPVGQSHRIVVTLRPTQAGRFNNTMEILSGGTVVASAAASVTAVGGAGAAPSGAKPTITVKKTGPQRAAVGQTAKFLIEVANTGQIPATQVRIVDHYDRSLDATFATLGNDRDGDDLIWAVDMLPAGKTIRYEVVCNCTAVMTNVCNHATVTSAEGVNVTDDACLDITAATASGAAAGAPRLTIAVADLGDAVNVGRNTTYEVKVTNAGQAADSQVVLIATLPAEMTPQAVGNMSPAKYTISGNTVRFEPVATLQPGEQLTYQIQARANQPGQARFRATIMSSGSPVGLSGEEQTTIYAQ